MESSLREVGVYNMGNCRLRGIHNLLLMNGYKVRSQSTFSKAG